MLTFEMDADNFGTYLGGGTADGTRVTGEGVRLDLAEHAGDGDTVGLWHLHDGVWTDASGNGHTLTPSGDPAFTDDGVHFDGDDDARRATGCCLQGHDEATLEAWVRVASLPTATQVVVGQHFNLWMRLVYTGGKPYLQGLAGQSGHMNQTAFELDDSFPNVWHHVAVTYKRNEPGGVTLWLDGIAVDDDDTIDADFSSADASLHVATRYGANHLTGDVDEVRLSTAVRYTGSFSPKRHVASGTFTSPALDTERTGCRWLASTWDAAVPETSALAMDVRSGDEVDGEGDVVGQWQSATEAPGPGRYAQWRATLTRGTDATGLLTPTLEWVTATASEAGYALYSGVGQEAASIDYASALVLLGPGVVSHETGALSYPAVHWFGLRSSNAEGDESRTVDAEVRLELDDEGERVASRPAPVASLSASGAGGGTVRLAWLALGEMGEVPPQVFGVYSNGGGGEINFAGSLGEVAYSDGLRHYEWTSAAFDDGLTVAFAVRAETDEGGVDAEPAEVELLIDAAPPAAVGYLSGAPALAD